MVSDCVLNGRMVDGEYQPWGGACRCRRCVGKIRREGFYQAPEAHRKADEETMRAIKERDAYEMEQLPHVRMGPPRETVAEYTVRVKAWRAERNQRMTAE